MQITFTAANSLIENFQNAFMAVAIKMPLPHELGNVESATQKVWHVSQL
jgi:hypothetical protein